MDIRTKHNVEIEGDWGEYSIRFVQLADIPKMLEFIAINMKDERMYQLAAPDPTYGDFSIKRIGKLLESEEVRGLSLIAIHKLSGEIAGVHLQFIWTKEAAFHPPIPSEPEEEIPPLRKILNLMHAQLQDSKLSIFSRYNVDYVVWNFLVSVDSKHRNKGLASELYVRILPLLKAKNHPLIFSIFTSPYSRRCAQKVGFIEIDKVLFNSLRNEKGEIVIPNGGDEDYASLMVLPL